MIEVDVDYKERSKLPAKSGIYFVKWGGSVLYIGQANNIRARWRTHHMTAHIKKLWGRVVISYILLSPEHLNAQENIFIQRYNPPFNIFSLSESKKEPGSYRDYIKHLARLAREKYGSVSEALEELNIPKGHFYNVINPNKITSGGNAFHTPLEWMVKLTRDSKDFGMLKKVNRDCGAICITPDDVEELKGADPEKALLIIQKVLGFIK